MKIAKFVPVAGYLLCPNCGEKITDSTGKVSNIRSDAAGPYWEQMAQENWKCKKCHRRFGLPVNPFKAESEVKC